jgi:hypothetical protein
MPKMRVKPKSTARPAAIPRGRRCSSSHRQTGRRAYARMNAIKKGVKISAITSNPLEFNDSTDPVAFFTNIAAKT